MDVEPTLTTIAMTPREQIPLERLNQLITATADRFVLVLDGCSLEEGGASKLAALFEDEERAVVIVPTLDGDPQHLDLAVKGKPSCYMIAVNRLFTRIGRPYVIDNLSTHAQIIQSRCDKRRAEVLHTSIVNALS